MYICGKQRSHVIRTDYFLTERWLFFFNLKNENVQFLTLIGMSYESKKKDSMSLAGCQIIPIDLNFHLQKCLEVLNKNSVDKTHSKNYKLGKSTLTHAN